MAFALAVLAHDVAGVQFLDRGGGKRRRRLGSPKQKLFGAGANQDMHSSRAYRPTSFFESDWLSAPGLGATN
jgi:hypothetical protein